jgi:hypothetical protein
MDSGAPNIDPGVFPINIRVDSYDDTGSFRISESFNDNTKWYKIKESPTSDTKEDGMFDFKLHNLYIHSNSPITMSENDSDSEQPQNTNRRDDESLEYDDDIIAPLTNSRHRPTHRHHEYEDIERALINDSEKDHYKYSRQLDILILFIKGQKNIYFQSRNLTQAKLFLFMIPTLIITIAVTVFAPIIGEYAWSGGFISGLNFLATSLITIMNFTKLESKTESYGQIASQYDKIETTLEIMSSKLFFIKSEEEKKELVLSKILETEVRLTELRDFHSVMIPNEIRVIFPIISHTNIFSFIKKIENQKRDLIFRLMNTKNEIHYILHKWKRSSTESLGNIQRNKEKNRLLYLYEADGKIKDDIIKCNQIFQKLEADFFGEICYTEKIHPLWILFCSCFLSKRIDSVYSSFRV